MANPTTVRDARSDASPKTPEHTASDTSAAPVHQAAGPQPPSAAREVAVVYAAISAATIALDQLARVPALRDYAHLGIAALFLAAAVQLAQRRPGGLDAYGLALGGLLEPTPPGDRDGERSAPGQPAAGPDGSGQEPDEAAGLLTDLRRAVPSGLLETGFALGLSAIVFPPFVVGFYLFHAKLLGAPIDTFTLRPPPDLGNLVLAQLLLVGLPEEALFRGYFQTRLGDLFPHRVKLLGARVSPGALGLQAVLFALLHFLVDLNPARLSVFFPGLLFGYIRDLRGGIGAALVFHALCNLLSEFLARGFLS